jgi:phage regulator Rha-like protein
MSNLVLVKKHNREEVPVTTSKLIAERTKNTHESVQKLIKNHVSSLENFGRVGFEIVPLETKGGVQETKIYYLNEQQSTLLVTFMRNNETVINFKIELVKQFYQMRQIIMQKQTQEWKDARITGKLHQHELSDAIRDFAEYAKSQGSQSSDKYYIHFSKLTNSVVGLKSGERSMATSKVLTTQGYILELIKRTIEEEMAKGTYYKSIYDTCKCKVNEFMQYVSIKQIGA